MTERWLPVHGYEGLYEVSDAGCVRNAKTGRKLVPYMQGKYPAVTLHKDGQRLVHRQHVIVLKAFKGERPEGHVGAHLDGNTRNASATNLAWVTPSENERHKLAHGTDARGEKSTQARLTDRQATIIREAHALGLPVQKIAELTGVYRSTIYELLQGGSYSPKDDSAARRETPNPLPADHAEVVKEHTCEHCGAWHMDHDYQHQAEVCQPKQIEKLEARITSQAEEIERLKDQLSLRDSLISTQERHVKALQSDIERITKELQEAGKALVRLTPDGSEFHKREGDKYVVDWKACISYLQEYKTRRHESMCEAVRARKAAESSLASMKERCKDLKTEAAFLLNRLEEWNPDSMTDDDCRDWNGHVAPSIARLSSALSQTKGTGE